MVTVDRWMLENAKIPTMTMADTTIATMSSMSVNPADLGGTGRPHRRDPGAPRRFVWCECGSLIAVPRVSLQRRRGIVRPHRLQLDMAHEGEEVALRID